MPTPVFPTLPLSFRPTAGLLCLALWSGASWAEDPVAGQALFEDTPNVSGVASTIFNSCANCHGTVQNRRTAIGGSPFADIPYSDALNALGSAIGHVAPMAQFQSLTQPQVEDLAAYIADVPRATAPGLVVDDHSLAFTASALNGAVIKNITVTHSVAVTENLRIASATLGSSTKFATSGSCNSVTLLPAGTCTFSVTYTASNATAENRALTITMYQGTSTTAITRTINLQGSVSGSATPTPPPASSPTASTDSGGGALGWTWLVGLSLGIGALWARQHARPGRKKA